MCSEHTLLPMGFLGRRAPLIYSAFDSWDPGSQGSKAKLGEPPAPHQRTEQSALSLMEPNWVPTAGFLRGSCAPSASSPLEMMMFSQL